MSELYKGGKIPPNLDPQTKKLLEDHDRVLTRGVTPGNVTINNITLSSPGQPGVGPPAQLSYEVSLASGNIYNIPIQAVGKTIIFRFPRKPTLKATGGNLRLSSDFVVDSANETITLTSDGTVWVEVARGRAGALGPVFVPAALWGALPDTGLTMTNQIQDAFDNCPTDAILLFLPGTYVIGDSVTLSRNINVWAYGVTFDLETNTPTGTITNGIPATYTDGGGSEATGHENLAERQAGTLVDTYAFLWTGTTAATRPYRNFIRGLTVTRTVASGAVTERSHLGIVAEGPFECSMEDIRVSNFYGGLVCTGISTGGGFVNNSISRVRTTDCRYSVVLYTVGSGYVNSNTFTDSRLSLSSSTTGHGTYTYQQWELLQLLWHSAATNNGPNNNTFIHYGLEGEDGADIGRKIRCEGRDNTFLHCRYENTNSTFDITVGESSRSPANFSRNNFLYGYDLQGITSENKIQFLSTSGSVNIGNTFLTSGVNIYDGVAGTARTTAHILKNGNTTAPVMSLANSSLQEVVKGYHVYSGLSAQGTFEFLDTGGTARNAIGMATASPYDFITTAGLNIASVFRVRPSSGNALLQNPTGAGKIIYNAAAGTFDMYSSSSVNNDVLRILDAGQDERIVIKGGSADWGAGHYGVIEFWEESTPSSPTRANAMFLHSSLLGATRPIAVNGGVYFNRGATASAGRFRGSSNTSLMEWDAVNDRVGINTTSPAAKLDIVQAGEQLRLSNTAAFYSSVQTIANGFYGGLAIEPLTNSSSLKWVHMFGQSDSTGLSFLDDGSTYYVGRNGGSSHDLAMACGSTKRMLFQVGAGTNTLVVQSTGIDLFVPGSYRVNNADNSTVTGIIGIYKNTTGTAMAGCGSRIDWQIENDGGNLVAACQQDVLWTAAGALSEDSSYQLKVKDAGTLKEIVRVAGALPGVRIENVVGGAPAALLDVRGAAIFNEDGADADFRWDSQSTSARFFLDASTDRVGIGTTSPTHGVDIRYTASGNYSFSVANASGANPAIRAFSDGTQGLLDTSDIRPFTTNTHSLGTASLMWKQVFVSGDVQTQYLQVNGSDPGTGSVSTIRYTNATDTPTTDPGWTSSSTVDMNAPDGYIKAYVGTQAVVIPYWNT